MKASVYVRLKPDVLDPEGRAVARALADIGVGAVRSVRVAKRIDIELDAASNDEARALLERAARELLANPVMEDYEVVVESDA